ncbi:unnamed protein product [Heterobilharzia americana]|nr:unnamed protein product [Heterobilharzia americana]
MDQNINLNSLTPTQKGQLMEQMRAEVALASARELLEKMSDKCFEKCITKPGTSLDNSEQVRLVYGPLRRSLESRIQSICSAHKT